MSGERDLSRLISGMEPRLRPGQFVMVTLQAEPQGVEVFAAVREAEGLTVVVEQGTADLLGWEYDVVLAWITLHVHSALDAVGLTAAFSTALAGSGISCNVLAGRFHDHILVPASQAHPAMDVLQSLSRSASDRP